MLINIKKIVVFHMILLCGLANNIYGSNYNNSLRYYENNIVNRSKDPFYVNISEDNANEIKTFFDNIKNNDVAFSNAFRGVRSLLYSYNNISSKTVSKPEIISKIYNLLLLYSRNNTKSFKQNPPSNNTTELVIMILNYYISNILDGNFKSIKQYIPYVHSDGELLNCLDEFQYFKYCEQYFDKSILETKLGNFSIFGGITQYDWNTAVSIIKQLDLFDNIKRLVTGINVCLYEAINYSRTQKYTKEKISPVIFNNGVTKCWLVSTFQLISAAVNLYESTKSKIDKPNEGYVFCEFIKYLKQKSAQFIDSSQHTKYLDIRSDYFKKEYLDLIKEITLFDEELIRDGKSDYANNWNELPGVKEAKRDLSNIKDKIGSYSIDEAYDILTRIFPELKEIIYSSKDNLFSENTIAGMDYVPKDDPRDFFILKTSNKLNKNDDLENYKYLISFGEEDIFIYELVGVQLNTGFHLTAFTKMSNESDNWCYSDSTGYYSLYSESLNDIKKINYGGIASLIFSKYYTFCDK